MGQNLFDPDVLKVVLPYLIVTGGIGVVVAGFIVWMFARLQGQQISTQRMLIDFTKSEISGIRTDVVASGKSQQMELQETNKTLQGIRDDRRGDLSLMVKLVDVVQGTGDDMNTGLAAHTKNVTGELTDTRTKILTAIQEEIKANEKSLAGAVERSMVNQDKNTRELKGNLDLAEVRIIERGNQNAVSIVEQVKQLGELVKQQPTAEQHARLVIVVEALQTSVNTLIDRNATRPLPPLTGPDVSAVVTVIGDVVQPPSLVITHGEDKANGKTDGEVTQ